MQVTLEETENRKEGNKSHPKFYYICFPDSVCVWEGIGSYCFII